LTESGNSHKGRADNRPPIVLDGDMRKIATEGRVPEYDHQAWFDRWLKTNGDKRIVNPKSAWRAWCKTYKRDSRDFEGNPTWTPELLAIAVKAGMPASEAERDFWRQVARSQRKRKIRYVIRWWSARCKAYKPEPKPEPKMAEAPESTNLLPSKMDELVRDWEGISRRRDGRPIGPVGTQNPPPWRRPYR
jgi:hypothetical protein